MIGGIRRNRTHQRNGTILQGLTTKTLSNTPELSPMHAPTFNPQDNSLYFSRLGKLLSWRPMPFFERMDQCHDGPRSASHPAIFYPPDKQIMITEVRRQFGVRRKSGSEDVHLQRRKEADPTPRGTSRRRTEHGSLGMNQHLYGYTHNSFARRVQVLKRRYRRMVFCCRPQGDEVTMSKTLRVLASTHRCLRCGRNLHGG